MTAGDTYPPTPRTTALRHRDRIRYDRNLAHEILDEAYHCHLAFTVDGEPRILPTLHVRIGDTVYVHGSTGSRPLLASGRNARSTDGADSTDGAGLPVCLAVTHLDGLVLARSHFHHSANYRSVIVHGSARPVADETEKRAALTALVDKVAPGRAADSRPPTRRELAETGVLALQLHEVSVKVRAGGVNDSPADLELPHWAGVVPLRFDRGVPEPDAGITGPVPAYLQR